MCIFVKCIYVDLCIVVCLDTCIFASLYIIFTCTYEVRIHTIFLEVHVFVYICKVHPQNPAGNPTFFTW